MGVFFPVSSLASFGWRLVAVDRLEKLQLAIVARKRRQNALVRMVRDRQWLGVVRLQLELDAAWSTARENKRCDG